MSPRYANEWSSAGFINELPAEFFKVPVLWVHGHTHDSFDYQIGNCRVVCNPRGYVAWTGKVENRDFAAGFVVVIRGRSALCIDNSYTLHDNLCIVCVCIRRRRNA